MTLYAERKAEHVALARQHYAADMLKKGTYGERQGYEFRGCSVGCMWHSIGGRNIINHHADIAEYFLYPEWMTRLQDTLFEGLPSPEHLHWHVTLAEKLAELPEDYDWQLAFHRIMGVILCVVLPYADTSTEVVRSVIGLHGRATQGETIAQEEWRPIEALAAETRWEAATAAAALGAAADRAAAREAVALRGFTARNLMNRKAADSRWIPERETAARWASARETAIAAARWAFALDAPARGAAAAARWAIAAAPADACLQVRDAVLAALNPQE
jgi:hypothetical protein